MSWKLHPATAVRRFYAVFLSTSQPVQMIELDLSMVQTPASMQMRARINKNTGLSARHRLG